MTLVTKRLDLEEMAVCAPAAATRADINAALRDLYPDEGWSLSRRRRLLTGYPIPHPCEDEADRVHWLATRRASAHDVLLAGPLLEPEVAHA